jgi:hypothetical protein
MLLIRVIQPVVELPIGASRIAIASFSLSYRHFSAAQTQPAHLNQNTPRIAAWLCLAKKRL